jgi:hypothetical protein
MIINKPLLKEFFFAALITAILHFFALKTSLYWTTEWFDIVMHFLGGLTAGLGVFFVILSLGMITHHEVSKKLLFFSVITGALLIGVVWELWELFMQFTDISTDMLDTVLDIVMDTVGAICAFGVGKRYLENK